MESTKHEMQQRAIELRRLTAEMLNAMTPQQRDRQLQEDLARSRGQSVTAYDGATPEDFILMKLDWRRESRSEKQWRNALSVAQVKGARLDWKYLFTQAKALDIEDDLTKLRDEAGI